MPFARLLKLPKKHYLINNLLLLLILEPRINKIRKHQQHNSKKNAIKATTAICSAKDCNAKSSLNTQTNMNSGMLPTLIL